MTGERITWMEDGIKKRQRGKRKVEGKKEEGLKEVKDK